jgi:hypothetical protein
MRSFPQQHAAHLPYGTDSARRYLHQVTTVRDLIWLDRAGSRVRADDAASTKGHTFPDLLGYLTLPLPVATILLIIGQIPAIKGLECE